MATNYTDLLNWVMPDLPMAPATTMVVNAIRDATIELCERSLCYRQELQQILVLPPTSTTTTVAQVLGDQQVTVADMTNFFAGDTITVALADSTDPGAGSKWRGHTVTVAGLSGAGIITLDGQLPDAVNVGAAVTKLVDLYAMTMPSGTAMAKGLKAWLNDNPIDPMSIDDSDNEFNNTSFGWVGVNWRTDVNLPTRFSMPDDGTVQLFLPPSTAGNLRILAALKPTRASTSFPTWIYERYVEAIAHGAKARIMLIPKKPYSDKETGAWHQGQFDALTGEAKIRAARGNTRGPLRTHTVFGLR